ncbi:MAG: N-acetylmuramoyl-L-alanine amidase [Lachnospiraceae bacterium]|nr:N-acetylmuramoyl-L-alanine amidase [Lachnospiraceae bacterium]
MNKTIGKIFSLLLVLCLLAGCNGSSNTRGGETETVPATTEEETIPPTKEAVKAEETTRAVSGEKETKEETKESTEASTEEETKAEEKQEIIYSTSDRVNVRAYPDLSGAIEGQIEKGTELVRLSVLDNGWSEVMYQDRVCYVYTELFAVKETEDSEPLTVAPIAEIGIHEGTGIYYGDNSGPLVAIDAGHQRHGDSSLEPNAPGSDVMKAKVTSGTQGVSTGVPEYILNLDVSLKLRDALLAAGYRVLMIRETHDVTISNAERAELANEYKADIFLRVHANGSDDQSVSGTLTMAPSAGNPYVGDIAASSQSLCALITDAICRKTGFVNRGVLLTDTMTGINWCKMPVAIIEMGFMSNPYEDEAMQQEYIQDQIVSGIVEAVDSFFG